MNQWKQVEIDDVITLEEILLEEKAEKLEMESFMHLLKQQARPEAGLDEREVGPQSE